MNGNWAEIPELTRKVTKHAPSEKTLVQTATAEHYVASQASRRPQTATSISASCLDTIRQIVNSAKNALAEEVFQAQACLIWAAWNGIGKTEPDNASIADVVPLFDRYGQKATSQWTKICLLRTALFRAKGYATRNQKEQALVIYRAAAAWVELNNDLVKSVPQLSFWAEQLLAEYALMDSEATSTEARQSIFQLWSQFTKNAQAQGSIYGCTSAHPSRDTVWAAYYNFASHSLQRSQYTTSASRVALASQLRTIEAAYESSFLRNHKFPKATESNSAVEEWVESVIRNWLILCGPGWRDDELSHGRNGVTRNVLDILYRAAMMTFHSTLILRRLFQVHKSLAEFDLAYSCLDTYMELVDRDRERATKAGELPHESDEVMLLTISEGIEGLCSYGQQKEAQKAFDLACRLEDWLAENDIEDEDHHVDGLINGRIDTTPIEPAITARRPSDDTLQLVYRAIGIAKAHWAKWTPFSENRTDLQTEALSALNTAASTSQPLIPTLYALALLCAEMRQISQALRWTKLALQKSTEADPSLSVPAHCALWHLLTLLLSSQQDFETALQSSTAALDSVVSTILPNKQNGFTEKDVDSSITHPAIADLECDDLEKLTALQVTYMALVELVDGPEAALNRSGELLSFYSTLFKRFEVDMSKSLSQEHLIPPSTSAGTIKSVKGSVFSRRRASPSIAPSVTTASVTSEAYTEKSARPMTQASQAPTIQVTDESGKSAHRKHHHSLIHRHHNHDTARETGNKSRPSTAKTVKNSDQRDFGAVANGNGEKPAADNEDPLAGSGQGLGTSAKQPLKEMDHNLIHDKAPPPLGHTDQPPEQDTRLPHVNHHTTSTSPIPRAPKAASQKHALVVLVKMWLTVATLYRRSHMFEDARESCEEASKAATRIESLVASSDPSARALAEASWGGGGKSSDQVWADIYCTKAELLYTIVQRRAEEGVPATSESIREVVEQYEHCLMYEPNHAHGIIGLSNILLDYYDRKVDLSKKVDDGKSLDIRPASRSGREEDLLGSTTPSQERLHDPFSVETAPSEDLKKTPENLNRIAARDRAYGLLNTLSKLGKGWDSSETWFALARAHELGGEIDKAKNILWWCIELEDTRPIRHWSNLGCGGYVL